jgi:hypothetical protein
VVVSFGSPACVVDEACRSSTWVPRTYEVGARRTKDTGAGLVAWAVVAVVVFGRDVVLVGPAVDGTVDTEVPEPPMDGSLDMDGGTAVVVWASVDGTCVLLVDGALDGAGVLPVGGDPEDGAVVKEAMDGARTSRELLWVWTGSCGTLNTTPITKLLISVHTPHTGLLFRLEEMVG